MEILLGLLCFGIPLWILFGIVAGMIGGKKGEGCLMFFLGFLLGPFGVLIALFSSGNRKVCPHCRELIDRNATVCSHCHRDQPIKAMPPPLQAAAPTQPVAPISSPIPKPATDSTMPCPLCGQQLRVSTFKQGENWCPHCFEKFVVE
jgi:hypothetical protein